MSEISEVQNARGIIQNKQKYIMQLKAEAKCKNLRKKYYKNIIYFRNKNILRGNEAIM